MRDRSNEPTETEERVAENAAGNQPRAINDHPAADSTGLLPGQHDDDRSPLDGILEDPAKR